jgi:hypothetical protein
MSLWPRLRASEARAAVAKERNEVLLGRRAAVTAWVAAAIGTLLLLLQGRGRRQRALTHAAETWVAALELLLLLLAKRVDVLLLTRVGRHLSRVEVRRLLGLFGWWKRAMLGGQ